MIVLKFKYKYSVNADFFFGTKQVLQRRGYSQYFPC